MPVEVCVDGEEDGDGERAERGVDEDREHEPAGYARRPRGVNPDSNRERSLQGRGAAFEVGVTRDTPAEFKARSVLPTIADGDPGADLRAARAAAGALLERSVRRARSSRGDRGRPTRRVKSPGAMRLARQSQRISACGTA